jgi:hypothetical protein
MGRPNSLRKLDNTPDAKVRFESAQTAFHLGQIRLANRTD